MKEKPSGPICTSRRRSPFNTLEITAMVVTKHRSYVYQINTNFEFDRSSQSLSHYFRGDIFAQVTEGSFEEEKVKEIIKIVNRDHEFRYLGFSYPATDPETLHVIEYSDDSFATNEDGSSQL